MSKISIVKGVEVSSHDAYGDLMFVSYRYTREALMNRDLVDNRGLVVFFRQTHELVNNEFYIPVEKEEWTYIKSFIMNTKEVHNIVFNDVDIVRDLGYIMSFSATSCEILNLGSYATVCHREDNYAVTDTYGQTYFEISNVNVGRIAFANSIDDVGIAYAIREALINPIETDFLVSSMLPKDFVEEDALILDYRMGGNK